ncbi:uncharacterized protein MONOS_11410 [Monocercomonoides exilis]|uniref:uncharacterized protein n=1 Tax=Monocercomonoides exilis TaxID=2049356 RepID=UPI00355A47C5|nr:hypothetical protein MONOS_11410 [Monocercomonoides exilis]|eukprot:MONOS_11410.1-p1 / transcript=MONOS_11410.1 / gene=MONOS_11410 / organism=Monocercomonoides_exilis_PA203 / gene_product=unspecified product / transcript_product=unspecified product / location=Mono_scaffold00570:32921-35232(-) / protein_length=658 / sequence_SO=supercontig / SO=protein_coding / is_pseudo=false
MEKALELPLEMKEQIIRIVKQQLFWGSTDTWWDCHNEFYSFEENISMKMRNSLLSLCQMETMSESAHENAIHAFFAYLKYSKLSPNERHSLVPELLDIAERKALSEEYYAEAGQLLYALACIIEGSGREVIIALINHEHVARRVIPFLYHPCVNVVSEAVHVIHSFVFLNSRVLELLNLETNIAEILVPFINSYPSFLINDTSCYSAMHLPSSSPSDASASTSASAICSSSLQQKFQALPSMPLDPGFYPPVSSPFPSNHPKFCQWPSECIESPVYFVEKPQTWFEKSAADHLICETTQLLEVFFEFDFESDLIEDFYLERALKEDLADCFPSSNAEELQETEPGECINESSCAESKKGNEAERKSDSSEKRTKKKKSCKQRKSKDNEKDVHFKDALNNSIAQRRSGPPCRTYFPVLYHIPGFVSMLTKLFEQKQMFTRFKGLMHAILCNVIKRGRDKDVVEWIGRTRILKMFCSYAFNESIFSEYNESISWAEELWDRLLKRRRKSLRDISAALAEEETTTEHEGSNNRTADDSESDDKKRKRRKEYLINSQKFSEKTDEINEILAQKGMTAQIGSVNTKRKKIKDMQQEKERMREERKQMKAEKEMTRKRKKKRKEIRTKIMSLEVCKESMRFLEEEGLFDLVIMITHKLPDLDD